MDSGLKVSFSKIKGELDIHLDSINGNTNEINANFEHIARVEQKVDKLEERLDEIQMLLSNLLGTQPSSYREKFEGIKLSPREQEVFLTLYTADQTLTFSDVAKRIGLTDELVQKYTETMISKGIPLIKTHQGSRTFLRVDNQFKQLQAKENILNIHEGISSIIEH